MEEIILCEPQCWGFEHSSFNAALLQTVSLAYPSAHITFLGEGTHVELVRAAHGHNFPPHSKTLEWQVIVIPPRRAGMWWRLRQESKLYEQVLRLSRRKGTPFILLTSVTNTAILALKSLLDHHEHPGPILAIPHSILATLESRQLKLPWNWPLRLGRVMRWHQPTQLRYIALGKSIHDHLKKTHPELAVHFRPLDPPYPWQKGPDLGSVDPEHSHRNICFGFIGVASRGKGYRVFARLASEIGKDNPLPDFLLAGFLAEPLAHLGYAPRVRGLSTEPLSLNEFHRRAADLTYAVFSGDPRIYRLTASASFLDALSFVKPGIYLRNPYVEHYFERMGDIGYLCDSYEEMRDIILSILKDFPAARYRRQQENIVKGRRIFEPETLAPRLREIVEEFERSLSPLGPGRNPKFREEARLDP